MHIQRYTIEPFASNFYVIREEASREAILVDPGGFLPDVVEELGRDGWQVRALIATHGHFDHILEAGEYTTFFRQGLWLHQEDWPFVHNLREQLGWFGLEDLEPAVYPNLNALTENQKFILGDTEFLVIHTPGHSPGSVVIWSPKEKIAFSGDLLFRGSIGRTDLPGGDPTAIQASLEVVFSMWPDDTQIFPGHGPETTAGEEKKHNPFLKNLSIPRG